MALELSRQSRHIERVRDVIRRNGFTPHEATIEASVAKEAGSEPATLQISSIGAAPP